MYIVKRQSSMGGFNVRRKGGAIPRLYGLKSEGLGKAQTEEFYEKTNVEHPFKTLSGGNLKGLENAKIKRTKPKRYISLNF